MTEVTAPAGAPDGLGDLVSQVTDALRQAGTGVVDDLHLAALLESRGINDEVARQTYRHDDVFALAATVTGALPLAGSGPDRPAQPAAQPQPSQSQQSGQSGQSGLPVPGRLSTLAHGPLYLVPSTVYPAVLTLVGPRTTLYGLVCATALGWVWGMGMSAVAYQHRSRGDERAAGRALRLLGAAGVALAATVGGTLVGSGVGGAGLALFVTCLVAVMLASGVLVFYGHELLLGYAMLPALVAGGAHVASGFAASLVRPAVALGGVSVVLVTASAWWASRIARTAGPGGPGGGPGLRPLTAGKVAALGAALVRPLAGTLRGALPGVAYAALCAAFLLFTDVRFVAAPLDLAVAAAPLVVGMGAVEWRAHRFASASGRLLDAEGDLEEYRRAIWRLLLRELWACATVLAGLAVAFFALLEAGPGLTLGGALLVDAHVVLGCGYFLCFVLARQRRFDAVLGVLATVLAADVVLVAGLVPFPGGAVEAFALTTAAMLLLLLAAFRRGLRDVHRHCC